ncbi:hypothetical protein Ajs_2733 [Acidovorax sp. JS42]|nr:hypothetical protein Ajs_2733 [Acidovorax sp. JS42]
MEKIADSTQAFCARPPDYNAALVNARVALETLAADVAAEIASTTSPPPAYNAAKWLGVHLTLQVQQRSSSMGRLPTMGHRCQLALVQLAVLPLMQRLVQPEPPIVKFSQARLGGKVLL